MSTEISSTQILPTSMRAAIIASSYWVLSLSLTVQSGSIASFIGCLLACYYVDGFIDKKPLRDIRLGIIIVAVITALLLANAVGSVLINNTLAAQLFGALGAFQLSEFVRWFAFSFCLSVVLRTVAHRKSWGPVLEILFVATAFVITLAAHRQGMIHRPFFIGDYALTRGIDPSSILMAMGCAAVLSLAALLMIENNQRRLPYHFTVLSLLCFSLLAYISIFGLPSPQITDDLRLTGQAQTQGANDQSENPFNSSENDASDKEAPVAIVLFRNDYEPVNGAYYFREAAYSQFNGKMLDTARLAGMDEDLIGHFTASTVDVQVPIRGEDRRKLVRTTIGLLTPHRTPFGLDSPVSFANTPNPNNLRFKRTYDAFSMVPEFEFPDLIGQELGNENWSDEVREEYLKLPDDPRYKELAEDLIAALKQGYSDDPYAKALAIKNYLDVNGIYSLKNDHAYAEDPAGSFLFGDLTGYCMHFSFAATYLFRSIGIPARVGLGYSVPAENRAGGSSLLIQAINGHAWPEIYLRDYGWVIVDPAPQQTLVDMSIAPQNTLQQLLGDMLRNEASFEEFLDSQRDGLIDLETVFTVLMAALIAALICGYITKFYRLWIPRFARPEELYRVCFRATLDTYASLGHRRAYGESRESFARRIGEDAPEFTAMTHSHLQYALGSGYELSVAGNQQNWLPLYFRCRSEIQQRSPLWKKMLAALNPFAWLMTR